MKLNLASTFVFPSYFVDVLVTQQFEPVGILETQYNSYKHVNKK